MNQKWYNQMTGSWYKDFKKLAMPLDPDAWRYDSNPHRFMSDQDAVRVPWGGVVKQKQDPKKLQERYSGVHLTFSPEVAAIYANGKADANDPPVIVQINISGLEQELDADASTNYAIDTYIQEKRSDWSTLIEQLDSGAIDEDAVYESILDDVQSDADMWMGDEGEVNDDASDFIVRNNRPHGPSVILNSFEGKDSGQIVQLIRSVISGNIPKEWHIRAVSQFRVMAPVGSERVIAIYQVPWINFGSIYQGELYNATEEELESEGYSRREDGRVVDDEGRLILDFEDVQYDHWLAKESLYENQQAIGTEEAWHGTSLERAKQSFPELFGIQQVAVSENWHKTAQNIKSLEQIATKVRASILQDDESLKSLCLPVSRHLAKVLINNGFAAAHVVQGTFAIDNPDPTASDEWDVNDFGEGEEANQNMEAAKYTPLHYWVQINNLVIDITADQFNDELEEPFPPVVIGDINALGRYTVIQENFIEPKIMYEQAK